MWTASDLGISASSSAHKTAAPKERSPLGAGARSKSSLSTVPSLVARPDSLTKKRVFKSEWDKKKERDTGPVAAKGGRRQRSYSEQSATDGASSDVDDTGLERDEDSAPMPLEESLLLVGGPESDSDSEEAAFDLDDQRVQATRVRAAAGHKHKQRNSASHSQPTSDADEDTLGAPPVPSSAPASPSKKTKKNKKKLEVLGGPKQSSAKTTKPKVKSVKQFSNVTFKKAFSF